MERLDRLIESSAVPYPELPTESDEDVLRVDYAAGEAPRKAFVDFPIATQVTSRAADTDISSPDFDFVRSIEVWHLEFYAIKAMRDTDCTETYSLSLGAYDLSGRFDARRTTLAKLPAWMNLRRMCPNLGYRAVGVSWRDYFGNEGRELVRY